VGGYRDLDVYRRTCALADRLRASVTSWPSFDLWTLGAQMMRSADSVAANIAEAYGRDTFRDRRRQIYVARGSVFELEHWLARASARELVLPPGAEDEACELSRMLNGLAQRWSEALRPEAFT
jgi:four helix bundle protein